MINLKLPKFPKIKGIKFKHIPNYLGFAASSDGRIWRAIYKPLWRMNFRDEWIINTQHQHQQGYYLTGVQNNLGIYKDRKSHVLILEAFRGPRPYKQFGLNRDDNKSNNILTNLRWGTAEDNWDDMRINGNAPLGTKNGFSKLNETDVRNIRELVSHGLTYPYIAKLFGIAKISVARIARREYWNHIV